MPQTYAELKRAVEVTMIKGQQEVDLAKVHTCHETGRLINEHVLLFKERADHGAGTIQRLADDVKVDRTVLLRCVQFVRDIPIFAGRRKLTWAHYRVLIPVTDARQPPGPRHRGRPERLAGGPHLRLRAGGCCLGRLRIDFPGRRIDLLVADAELAARRQTWQPVPRDLTGWLARYRKLITNASKGAVLAG